MNQNTLNDTHSLSHTKWNCKYHVVFAPKYRRKVFYEEKRLEVGAILRQLCQSSPNLCVNCFRHNMQEAA